MESIIASIIMLMIAFGIIMMLRDKIVESDLILKLGVFSLIISLLGSILASFMPLGIIIQQFANSCIIMVIIIKIYKLIFKNIERLNVKIGMFALFLFIFSMIMSEETIILDKSFYSMLMIIKMFSVVTILLCVLLESFNLIFKKDINNKLDDRY